MHLNSKWWSEEWLQYDNEMRYDKWEEMEMTEKSLDVNFILHKMLWIEVAI